MARSNSKKRAWLGVSALVAVGLLAAAALGASPTPSGVPTTVSFSARISEDNAAATGPLDMTFNLYATATGGTSLWQEAHTGVPVSAGFVSVQLGSQSPLDATLFDGSARFVEINIAGTTLSPRVPIASVPYALRASEAAHAALADTASSTDHATMADSATSAQSASKLGTLSATDVQKRVTGTCAAGSFVTGVSADGTVTCDGTVGQTQFAAQANGRCNWMVVACTTAQCLAQCPAGSHVESGGCDLASGSTLAESRPTTSGTFPSDEVNPVTAFDSWTCTSADNSIVQGAYAVCCTN